MPGAFKLDHLQPFKPILFPKFDNFFTFMLVVQFLLPQGERKAENGKREITKNGWETGVSVLWAFKLSHLLPVELILLQHISIFMTFILGLPFLTTPERGRKEENGSPAVHYHLFAFPHWPWGAMTEWLPYWGMSWSSCGQSNSENKGSLHPFIRRGFPFLGFTTIFALSPLPPDEVSSPLNVFGEK